jgi:hypothetical protein
MSISRQHRNQLQTETVQHRAHPAWSPQIMSSIANFTSRGIGFGRLTGSRAPAVATGMLSAISKTKSVLCDR